MMSPPSVQTGLPLTELPLTQSVVASPAKTSALPERVSALMAPEADCGANLPDLSEKSAQLGSLLKTCLRSEIAAQTGFSLTWKHSVTPGGRAWWVLSMSARRTSGIGSGLLPTPRAEGMDAMGADVTKSLLTAARFWPTPQARDGRSGDQPESHRAQRKKAQGYSMNLNDAVLVPTPTARDWKSGSQATQADRGRVAGPTLVEWSGGQLNPPWVEWLMGFPIGWTACDASETQLSLSFQNCSGEQS